MAAILQTTFPNSFLKYFCNWLKFHFSLLIRVQLTIRQQRVSNDLPPVRLKESLILIARFMGPTWGPSGADKIQVGPMLAPWTLLSGDITETMITQCNDAYMRHEALTHRQSGSQTEWAIHILFSFHFLTVFLTNHHHCPAHFANDIFMHFHEWDVLFFIRISLKFVPMGPFDNGSTLVRVMTWHRTRDKPEGEGLSTENTFWVILH